LKCDIKYQVTSSDAAKQLALHCAETLSNIFTHERIAPRAPAAIREAERLITIARNSAGGRIEKVHAQRLVASVGGQPPEQASLRKIAPRFTSRNGGYTRAQLGPHGIR
jgi:ribosomal protein L17